MKCDWEVLVVLINFKVKNFRSFKEEVEFSMEASLDIETYKESHVKEVEEYHLLKSAVLFGANASGKSNFVKALGSLFHLIVVPTKDANEQLYTNPFFGSSENTSYEIEFHKNSKHFIYTIELNRDEIVFEKLMIDNIVHFDRQRQNFVKIPQIIENSVNNVRKNQLLLFFAQFQNDSEAIEAYTWFDQDLIFADLQARQLSILLALKEKLKNTEFKERFLSLLKYADFNITDIDVLDSLPRSDRGSTLPRSIWLYIITTHTDEIGNKFKMTMEDESEGTKRFVLIMTEFILSNRKGGKVVVFDEFDKSLHIDLSQALLDLMNHQKQKNQFIFTTHEVSLMNHELRKDQIYFAEKNKNGVTDIYSLFDFVDVATGEFVNYKKDYRNGRYGAIPIISSVIMQSILEEEDGKTE